MARRPNILTIDPTKQGTRSTVPRLGEREAWKPTVEVGGKLAVKNLHAIAIELRKALRAGFKKRELMVFRWADGTCKLMLTAGFVAKHQGDEPDICGDLLDRYKFLQDGGYDNDMLYVSILDPETRSYEVGILDQPKRATYSRAKYNPVHELGANRKTRRAMGVN